jgi:hypothetical protein
MKTPPRTIYVVLISLLHRHDKKHDKYKEEEEGEAFTAPRKRFHGRSHNVIVGHVPKTKKEGQ